MIDGYSEASVRLPDSFWCYDPLTDEPGVSTLPALGKGYITFGSLNNFCKVNDGCLALWARVFRAVPGSRLLLLAPGGSGAAIESGPASIGTGSPRRGSCSSTSRPRPEYWQLYHQIDLCLDPLPYNGHTTSLDAFWMGVPDPHDAGPDGGGAGRGVPAQEPRPAGIDRRRPGGIREDRRGAGRRSATPERAPRDPATSAGELSPDGRPAFRPERRGRLPPDVAAVVCQVVGRWGEHSDDTAVACDRRAPPLKAEFAEACNNPGNALRRQGKSGEAAASYRQAVGLRPDFAQAHDGLGIALGS